MKNLLVVVDMVEGFVNFGALADKKINKVTPNILKLIKQAKENQAKIIAFRDCHSLQDEEFKTFPVHCLKGSAESQFIPEIKAVESNIDVDIEKNTTNGFITKEFQEIVNNITFDNVVVCGCCTDICVLNFVTSYLNYIKENNLKTNIIVIENACYTFDGENHNAEQFHNNAINQMEQIGAVIKKVNKNEHDKNLDNYNCL